ncbi:MAG: ABC transporter permease [Candidatus Rokubacteria bacterium]|nr:ABC transporter permease [Candidatus Rokubacteria bacterium]
MPDGARVVADAGLLESAIPIRRRRRANRALLIGGVIVGFWVAVVVAAPVVAPRSPVALDVMNRLQPPTWNWPMGTDEVGRDILSRILHGARITIPTAVGVILLASLMGCAVGAVAGYVGGRVDEILMRIVDVVLAFPSIVLAMAITAALGPGLEHAMLAIILVWWPEFSRLMRGQVLSVKENEYVTAARALGVPWYQILLGHVFPNAFPPIVVKATLDIGNAIILTGALSFIGLGAVPPAPEWGAMIAAGQAKFEYWWVATFPGVAILSVVLGFNFLGDGLQDLLNPRLRRD